MGEVRSRREDDLPLRRGGRHYSTDLRFMAFRSRPPFGDVVLYECFGVDHEERRTWVLRCRDRRWAPVLDRLAELRAREPVLDLTGSEPVVDLRPRDVVREPDHPPTATTDRPTRPARPAPPDRRHPHRPPSGAGERSMRRDTDR